VLGLTSSTKPAEAHGDVIEGREVSFLELFYDLVYVVVVSQAAGHLARDVNWAGLGRFAVVFANTMLLVASTATGTNASAVNTTTLLLGEARSTLRLFISGHVY